VDFRRGPDRVQVRCRRLFHTRIVLRHDSKELFVTMQRIKQGKGAFAPDR
jgi:hypothetical protein